MMPPRTNFDKIGSALVTVFIIIIGEDWPSVMYNFVRVYGSSGNFIAFYFIFVLIIGNFMLISLFTAILL